MTSPVLNQGSFLSRCLEFFSILLILSGLLVAATSYLIFAIIEPELPDIAVLGDIKLQVPLSIHSEDAKLIAQFGENKRIPIAADQIPQCLKNAFIAAEDDRFLSHPGVDYQGLLRAALQLVATGERSQGGSTITMQVARNFFLTREKTFMRKLKEIFLALRIERRLDKQAILSLYLNKIYLGHRAYGIGAAAQVYYGKSVDQLSIAECAMIAGLPKAPSRINPVTSPAAARERRNYVLRRMFELKYLNGAEFKDALKQADTAKLHGDSIELEAPYVAEMVRQKMVEEYGDEALTNGFRVYTTIQSDLQLSAEKALRRALHEYDERHGYRGPEARIAHGLSQPEIAKELAKHARIGDTWAGIVKRVTADSAELEVPELGWVEVSWQGMKWARKYRNENSRGPVPASPNQVVSQGDVVRIRRDSEGNWKLTQTPKVAGALVSLSPNDGAVVALVGGFDFYRSKYNRVTQAKRQPGSGFKPILYTTALEEGFTLSSVINDAPFTFVDPWTSKVWRPKNFGGNYYGPTRLRDALRKSRNLVSVRLLQEIGIEKVAEKAMQFGLPSDQIPRHLSMALGSGSATPLEMARAYAVFANGGFLIDPYLISRVEDREGKSIVDVFPRVACAHCDNNETSSPIYAPRIVSAEVDYLMTTVLKDVIRNGTAVRAKKLGRSDIAGKTGTTNDHRDAWFNGFSPALVTVSWVGFDDSKPLGNHETGSVAALPMWMYYTAEALKGVPDQEAEMPEGVTTAYIDPYSGMSTSRDSPGAILEYFTQDQDPDNARGERHFTSTTTIHKESEVSQIESLF